MNVRTSMYICNLNDESQCRHTCGTMPPWSRRNVGQFFAEREARQISISAFTFL